MAASEESAAYSKTRWADCEGSRMSSIASSTVVAVADLARVCAAATPKRKLFGGTKDEFHAVLQSAGANPVDFEDAGIVVATALSYLQENGIDLMASDHDDVASTISEVRGISCFIFTDKMR